MGEILRAHGAGKSYPKYRSELFRFARWLGLPVKPESEFWALQDVDFSIQAGEAVAIIGQNGAGKSTLLKVITGTVRPNEGSVSIAGKVSAILELGLGFNPELTGRQNILHSGGLLGYSSGEIAELMPKIEEFAEIGEHFEHPLRTYSSGMTARLAFSLVTATQPELLIVDEVLSVGDAYFQHKSFNRIREFKDAGAAVLMVTHSMGDVRELCDRVILMDQGRIVKIGPPDEIVDYYNALISEKENSKLNIEQRREKNGWILSRSGTFEANVSGIRLLDGKTDDEVVLANVGQDLVLEIEVSCSQDIEQLVCGVLIRDRTGHSVWGTNTWHTGQIERELKAGECIVYRIAFSCNLGPGSYSISPALVSSDTHLDDNYEWTDNMLVFEVANFDRPFFIGSNCVDAVIQVEREQS